MLLLRVSASGSLKLLLGDFGDPEESICMRYEKALLEHSSVSVVPSGRVK